MLSKCEKRIKFVSIRVQNLHPCGPLHWPFEGSLTVDRARLKSGARVHGTCHTGALQHIQYNKSQLRVVLEEVWCSLSGTSTAQTAAADTAHASQGPVLRGKPRGSWKKRGTDRYHRWIDHSYPTAAPCAVLSRPGVSHEVMCFCSESGVCAALTGPSVEGKRRSGNHTAPERWLMGVPGRQPAAAAGKYQPMQVRAPYPGQPPPCADQTMMMTGQVTSRVESPKGSGFKGTPALVVPEEPHSERVLWAGGG